MLAANTKDSDPVQRTGISTSHYQHDYKTIDDAIRNLAS